MKYKTKVKPPTKFRKLPQKRRQKNRKWTTEDRERITNLALKHMANGKSLSWVARKVDISSGLLVEWLIRTEKKEEYARVREIRAHLFFERLHDIMDRCLLDKVNPNAARVCIDGYRWMLGKMHPKDYGDRKQIDVNVQQVNMIEFVQNLSNDKRAIDITPEAKQLEDKGKSD